MYPVESLRIAGAVVRVNYMSQFLKALCRKRGGICSLRTMHPGLLLFLLFACVDQNHTAVIKSVERGSRAEAFSGVTGGRAPSFHDLSVGEAPAPSAGEGNGGGGKFPSQISHRKGQPGSLGTQEKAPALEHHDPTHFQRSSRTYPAPPPEVTNRLGGTGVRERQCDPGEILVRFRDETDEQTLARIQEEVGLETLRLVSSPGLYLMRVAGEISPEEAVKRLWTYKEVIFAEPNYVRGIQ